MFAYCGNNPVNRSDASGRLWEWLVIAGLVVGLLTGCSQQEETTYTPEEIAAFDAGVRVRELTNKDNNEYIAGIYKTDTGEYVVGNYYKGSHSSVDARNVIMESMEYSDRKLVAFVHSHPYCNKHIPNEFSKYGKDKDGNDCTYGDLSVAAQTGLPVYLAAPDGNLYVIRATDCFVYKGNKIWAYDEKTVRSGLPIDDTIFICGG